MTPQTGVPASGEIIIPARGACSLTPPPSRACIFFIFVSAVLAQLLKITWNQKAVLYQLKGGTSFTFLH